MQLYNTATRSLQAVQPIEDNKLRVYTCGPTVYMEPHIGNWRMFIFYDVLVRTLIGAGYDVTQVLNLTDVGHLVGDEDEGQDKLEKSAQAQKKTAWDIADMYITSFKSGLEELNIQTPDHMPRATDFMTQQIDLIKTLEQKGFTYKTDDGVYYDTSKFTDYGKMARLNTGGQEEGARVAVNTQKRNAEDFAVWKFSPKNQKRDMQWESPWGVGFPGWHLECSAMAASLLAPHIDIHAGGIDHIPIHHTNEIAQSEAAFDTRFANIWSHGSFMNVDGVKMSKSLGNVFTLADIKSRGFSPIDFRMLVLQAQYRTHQNFTWQSLMGAQIRRKNLQALADKRFQARQSTNKLDFEIAKVAFMAAMQHDINTPKALRTLAEVETLIEREGLHNDNQESFVAFLQVVDYHFGLDLLASLDITDEQKKMINLRNESRANKDFTKADEYRDILKAQQIELDDTPDGSLWRRI